MKSRSRLPIPTERSPMCIEWRVPFSPAMNPGLLWRSRIRCGTGRRCIALGYAFGESPSVLGLDEAVGVHAGRKYAGGLGAEVNQHQIDRCAGSLGIAGNLQVVVPMLASCAV